MAKGPSTNRPVETEPRIRRGYFECRYGQLHVHNAIPPGGGFEEGTPLMCVHDSLASGRLFQRFLALAGRDRSVYAPDTPGFGESDSPPSRPTIADYAAAMGDFLDTMRFRQIDLLGYQTGALIAAELAIARPAQVRRVVMVSVPVLNDAERETLRRTSWPLPPAENGSHLETEWRRTRESFGPGMPLEVISRVFAERVKSGPNAAWALAAAQQYDTRARLPLVTQSALILRPKDDLWEATARVRELLPRARFADLQDRGKGVFETAPETVMQWLKDFLRA
jgi:pimeloyl-ACP methyl ester carboxylesterase